jgi:hypothetical protein
MKGFSPSYQVHRGVKTIWSRLRYKLIGTHIFVSIPVMLDLQLPQSLGPGQGRLESVNAAIEVVLRLVKDFLGLQYLQDTILALENLLGKEKVGQLFHRHLGFLPLCRQKVSALRKRRLQFFDPLRSRSHVD